MSTETEIRHETKTAYAPATLGLYHLKRGNLERAEELYDEAISRSPNRVVKDRIKQRMSIEFAKAHASLGDERLALRLLDKALNLKNGFGYSEKETKRLAKSLPARTKTQ